MPQQRDRTTDDVHTAAIDLYGAWLVLVIGHGLDPEEVQRAWLDSVEV